MINATKQDLDSLLKKLNNEFIYSKNRSMGLEQRFPDLFSEEKLNNTYSQSNFLLNCIDDN